MMSKRFMILLVCFVMMASVAIARDTPTVTRIDPADLQEMTILTPPGDGVVGNLNPPAQAIGGWLVGDEVYKYLFNPSEQLPNCPVGFNLLSVHMLLQFSDDPSEVYPQEFSLYGDLETAVYDDALGCYVPGPEECAGPLVTITIDQPGLYDIEVPMDCPCAFIYGSDGTAFMYMLSMHFVGPVSAAIITDDIPVGCTSWNNWGQGWFDLVTDIGFPGELSMYGDVNCCSDPVAVEEKSWGDIKSLFR